MIVCRVTTEEMTGQAEAHADVPIRPTLNAF
jgi:hypothetical protein